MKQGDQRELFEGRPGLGGPDSSLPWEGRSPRALTRVGLGLFLRHKPPKSVGDFVDPAQCDIFMTRQKKAPEFVYSGAPLLSGSPKRR